MASLMAAVRRDTPSSMVVVGVSWALTFALSTRREAEKSSFFSSNCLLVRRGGLGGASEGFWELNAAVNRI
jgi:hypothetical protein